MALVFIQFLNFLPALTWQLLWFLLAYKFLMAILIKFLIIVKLYSVRNDFVGFAIAALIAWKLTVNKVIASAASAAITKTCHPILIL